MPLSRPSSRWSTALAVFFLATAAAAASAEMSVDPALSSESNASYGPVCFESLCDTDADCWNACPNAYSAVCAGNACHYAYSPPGGGGGGGGGPGNPGGPYCPAQLCWDSSQCVCGSYQGYCGSDDQCHF